MAIDDPLDPDAQPFDLTFTLTITASDGEMLSAMQAAGRFTDLEGVIEQALFQYAKHLGVGPVPQDFMLLRRRLNRLGRPYRHRSTSTP